MGTPTDERRLIKKATLIGRIKDGDIPDEVEVVGTPEGWEIIVRYGKEKMPMIRPRKRPPAGTYYQNLNDAIKALTKMELYRVTVDATESTIKQPSFIHPAVQPGINEEAASRILKEYEDLFGPENSSTE